MCNICINNYDESTVFLDCDNCGNVEFIPDLPNLKILLINNTKRVKNVSGLPKLEVLFAKKSGLESVSDLPKLKKLIAENTPLKSVPGDLYQLTALDIDNSNVESLPPTFVNLEWLSCASTKISEISEKYFSLNWLNIAFTQVQSLPVLPELYYMNCSQTGITDIENQPSLKTVICSGCNIDIFGTAGIDFVM